MAHLTLIDRAANRSYRVDAADAVVGRDPSAALVVEGAAASVVSARHARLFLDDGHWWVEDIGSRNGTYAGGRKLQPGTPHRLAVADEIRFGSTGPRLEVVDAVARTLAQTMAEPAPAVPRPVLLEPSQPTSARASESPAVPPTPARQLVRLVLRSGDGKRLVGEDVDVVIGRSSEVTIRVEGDMSLAVSRRHARVFHSGWKTCIEDLGSRNGTWLNRKRVLGPTVIELGDVIEFGAGGPRLAVENVEMIPAEARRTETEMPAQRDSTSAPAFVGELPTPPALPAYRASGDDK
jgi:pSer/pThr/pTyr-binding forkhead associated (FHA) protein